MNTEQTSKNLFTYYEIVHLFKGYLRYKTITSENVPSKAQVKNFFIL